MRLLAASSSSSKRRTIRPSRTTAKPYGAHSNRSKIIWRLLRILTQVIDQQDAAISSAGRSLEDRPGPVQSRPRPLPERHCRPDCVVGRP